MMATLTTDIPICGFCMVNYRCKENGVIVRLGDDHFVQADLYECPKCLASVLAGFGKQLIDRHNPRTAEEFARTFEAMQRGTGRYAWKGRLNEQLEVQ